MNFDSIILDVDGTIWDSTSVVADGWNKAIEQNYPQEKKVTAAILKNQFGKTMKTIADNLFTTLNDREKDILMEACCEQEQIALSENTKNITYDGVVEGIKKLSEKYRLFIVSNCQKGYIELVCRKNKITEFITDFECYGNNGLPKAENIKLIVKRNNLKSPVYVGDTQGDCDSSKEAGVPFVWVSYGFGTADSFIKKADSFSELTDFLIN